MSEITKIPKIVRQRLQRGVAAEPHPDVNLLSAFTEQSLEEPDRDRIMQHLAQCADCRQVVVLALPELETSVFQGRIPVATGWRLPGLRWVALGLCVVVIGAAVALHYEERVSDGSAAITTPTTVAGSVAHTSVVGQTETSVAEPEEKRLTASASTPSGITAETLRPPSNGTAAAKGSSSGDAIRTREAFAGTPLSPSTKNLLSSKTVTPLAPRWTLTADGVLQRSLDAGKTWEPISVSSNATFRVLSAFGSHIWVGGMAGALYHSSDAGQNWSQILPTLDAQPLTADITGIEFTDAQHGKISTAGETWTTSDAGQTWQK